MKNESITTTQSHSIVETDQVSEVNNAQMPVDAIDIASLRLSSNFGATLGVKKLLNLVPVGKPLPTQFFRTHPSDDMQFEALLLTQKGTQETYLVTENIGGYLPELVKPATLIPIIDRQNNVRLVPIPFPGPDGQRNPWHQSLLDALLHAKKSWIRVAANMHVGGYDVYEAQAELPAPIWPEHSMDVLVKTAFRGKIISDLDHPVIQGLQGRV